MKTFVIASAVGVLALGIMLTMSGNAMAQAAPLAEFAVFTGVTGSGFSGELRGTVPFVPVRGKRYGGWKGDWRYWSYGPGWYP
ncbi:MAG: hypothetical protein RDU20_02270, partial [Desulfomonilaceae bacterium]|nr:hypothetical protein [Desulfomonilaceae bacterium]